VALLQLIPRQDLLRSVENPLDWRTSCPAVSASARGSRDYLSNTSLWRAKLSLVNNTMMLWTTPPI